MANEKVYANGVFFKQVETSFGNIIKASISVEDFKQFLDDNADNGWVNIDILERKEVSDKGHSHYGVLNTFKPKGELVHDDRPESTLPF